MIRKLMFAALALALFGPVGTGQAADLAHRWSFNGNLVDSVAGRDAVIVDLGASDATLSDGQVILAGGGKDTSDYVDLPDGVVSALGDSATIEVWATQNTIQNWSRIWDFGTSTSENVFMSWTRGTTLTQDRVSWADPGHTPTVDDSVAPFTLGTEFHIVCVFQPGLVTWYAAPAGAADLGAARGSFETTNLLSNLDDDNVWIGRSQWPDNTAGAGYNEVRFWRGALTAEELEILHDLGPERLSANVALSPLPANGAANVLPDVVLSWRAADGAETHDVYLGTSLDDVQAATSADAKGVLVSAGQEATAFDAGRLEFGTTYYWRVDEVGPAPDFTVNKGDVWRFTVEPVAYPLGSANITATASSSNDATMGPEKTIDGSGLNAAGEHSTLETDMWLSATGGAQPTWIQYEFDQVYALTGMLIWNSNQAMEPIVGYGARDVTVEFSEDGSTWTDLGTVEFGQALGEEGYKANTALEFGSIPAQFIKLTIGSNWGGVLPQYGLSEVQFSYLPVRPTALHPADGTINLDSPVTLSWRAGREAATYDLYLGTDPENLPLVATTDETTYVASVDVGNVYYWKVVAVNEAADPSSWESAVQSFSTVAVPTNPGTDNLMHQWTFNDGTANDSVGEAHGALVGGAAVVDGALVTTAQDQWMEMPGDAIAMNTYDEVSIVAWYTPTAGVNTGYHMLAYFGDSVNGLGSNGFFITTARGDNVSRAGISIGDVATPWASESGANGPEYDDGKPHLMVGTIDATHIKLYIDGVLTASTPLSATNKISGISPNLAYLAKGGYTADPEWIGAIHEFSIYNKALSGGEVLYLAQLVPQDPGTANLTHQWTFEDGTVNDSVGAAHGTLIGGAAVVDGALVTSAQDQWMEMPGDVIAINTYEAFSIAGWYTPQAGANTGYHMLCYFGDSVNNVGANGFFFTPARGNNVSRTGISVGNTTAPWEAESGADGPETDDANPHFVVATIDATHVTLYMDGVMAARTPLSPTNKISGLSNNLAYLAKGGYGADPEWLGSIEEFRIYDKALTIGEVRFLAGAQ